VTVGGLDPERTYGDSRLLFLPDAPIVGPILSVLGAAFLLIGALVATGLALLGARG
jgi:hypothetical protein